MNVKSNHTIAEFGVFSIGIILYMKIEEENNKVHQLGQIYWRQFERMGKIVFIEITGQLLSSDQKLFWAKIFLDKVTT